MEEEIRIAPWVGPTSGRNFLSVVVLSTNIEITKNISEALSEVHSKGPYQWKLTVHRAKFLEDLLEHYHVTGSLSIDFIVIALDTANVMCIEWAFRVLKEIHHDLKTRRVVLVNACGLPANSMAVNAGELLMLQDEFNIDLLSSNVYKIDDAVTLAERMLKYIETTVGVKTGIPNLNI